LFTTANDPRDSFQAAPHPTIDNNNKNTPNTITPDGNVLPDNKYWKPN
jgi:hypothetical protein